MKKTVFLFLSFAVLSQAQAQKSLKAKTLTAPARLTKAANATNTGTMPPAEKKPEPTAVKTLPSINVDKYLNVDDAVAIREIDSLHPNTRFNAIENIENVLYGRKFDLVGHLVSNYGVVPNANYFYSLNKYEFVCGVGLKRTKDVSPACMQPRVYQTNSDSERKTRLARVLLRAGVRPDFNAVSGCIGKNELDLFKVMYSDLRQQSPEPANGERLLVSAADAGTLDIVRYLLDEGVSANAYDHSVEQEDFKFYALYRSVKYPEIFSLLVERGADIRRRGYRNTTPVIHAARDGCVDVLRYLLQQGIDPYEIQGDMSAFDMAKKFNQKNKKEVLELFKAVKSK